MTSKAYGGILIGMSEYINFYDRKSEPLIGINTYSKEEQNWKGEGEWDTQIHYKNFYDIERKGINIVVICGGVVLEYETFKDRGLPDLYKHYEGFKNYGEPIF